MSARGGKPSRKSSCTGKERYSRGKAVFVAKVMTRECGERMHAYPCRYCNRWHIGHNFSF